MKNRFKHLNKKDDDPRFWVAEGELLSVAQVIPDLYSDNLAKIEGEHLFYFVYWERYAKHNDKWYSKQVKCYSKKEAKSVYRYAKKQKNIRDLMIFVQKEKYFKIKKLASLV